MNDGILRSGYAPPPMPRPLLGSPVAVEMVDPYGYDADALRYIRAVEAADGGRLEVGVRAAINAFVVGCKSDGIWDAIKASCILCGARTLAGALVPLVGAAPTNFNFVSSDYNRKTGLIGNTSTKYLDTNRNNNADPQNNKHVAMHLTTLGVGSRYLGTASAFATAGSSNLVAFGGGSLATYLNSATAPSGPGLATGFFGGNRSASSTVSFRNNGATGSGSATSQTPENASLLVFRSATTYTSCRAAFYSIGESLNLALLDARVTALVNSLGAAI